MDLSLAFLGTGGSVPTARRATASLLDGEEAIGSCSTAARARNARCTALWG